VPISFIPMIFRSGIGFDVHALVSGRRLVVGGVEIPFDLGLEGHSDADVLCHAVMDALLGAAGDGDIGRRFPNTDARWKDACSLDMLSDVAGRVRELGFAVCNVDTTILAQAPRFAPHIDAMRAAMAKAMGVPVADVSVKATTTERLGFVGRVEGIAAMAVAALEKKERVGK